MAEPALSVILATDKYETVRRTLERWRRQTLRKQIEIVLVAPSEASVKGAEVLKDEFAAVRVVVDPVDDLAPARAVGIRAAAAPIIFVGETHSFPNAQFVEVMLEALSGEWTSITPAFENANPDGAMSWAAFLSDYGRWASGLPPGEIAEGPVYNAAFRKAPLLQMGERLVHALTRDDELWATLRKAGHRVYFEPRAVLEHANISNFFEWVRQRFLVGLLIASGRVERWSMFRRVVYIGGSFLIPLVLLRRVVPGVVSTARSKRLPWTVIPLLVFGEFIKAAGEFSAYLGFSGAPAERAMHEYELHKLSYVRFCPS